MKDEVKDQVKDSDFLLRRTCHCGNRTIWSCSSLQGAARPDTGGVTAISRWLRAAVPPDSGRRTVAPRPGCQKATTLPPPSLCNLAGKMPAPLTGPGWSGHKRIAATPPFSAVTLVSRGDSGSLSLRVYGSSSRFLFSCFPDSLSGFCAARLVGYQPPPMSAGGKGAFRHYAFRFTRIVFEE